MTITRTSLGLAAGLAAALAIALQVEGGAGSPQGTGLLLGYCLGGLLAALGVAWQAHWLARNPARAGQAQIEAVAVKFGAALLFALLFRFVEELAQLADWQAFLLAFAAAVLLTLPLSTWDLSKLIAARRAQGALAASRRSA